MNTIPHRITDNFISISIYPNISSKLILNLVKVIHIDIVHMQIQNTPNRLKL